MYAKIEKRNFSLGRFGRRQPLCIYLLIGGVMCISAGLIPAETGRVTFQP